MDGFYEHNLRRSRPVVIYVTGRDACSLWDELKPPEVEASAAEEPGLSDIDSRQAASAAADGKTPLAVVTLGWDYTGSPFSVREFRECSTKVLELPQVVRWFVSHHHGRSPSPKARLFDAVGVTSRHDCNIDYCCVPSSSHFQKVPRYHVTLESREQSTALGISQKIALALFFVILIKHIQLSDSVPLA